MATESFVGRNELIKAIAASTGLPQTKVLIVLTAFMETVKATVKAGTAVRLSKFGTFRLRHFKARTVKAFKKGSGGASHVSKKIPARKRGAFRVSSEFLSS